MVITLNSLYSILIFVIKGIEEAVVEKNCELHKKDTTIQLASINMQMFIILR